MRTHEQLADILTKALGHARSSCSNLRGSIEIGRNSKVVIEVVEWAIDVGFNASWIGTPNRWELIHQFRTMKLIYREQNMVADNFAKSALGSTAKKVFFTVHELPLIIQKIIIFDRIGIPNFHSPCN